MKRLLLPLVFLVFSTICALAQPSTRPQLSSDGAIEAIQARNWLIGTSVGNLGYNFKSETFQFEIMPRAGYFVSDNALLGAQTQLGLTFYDGGELFSWGITPFGRYYIPEGSRSSGRWFGEALVGLGGSSLRGSDEDAVFSFVWGLGVGYAHFVASNVALEGTLGYTSTSADIQVGNERS
ncbi:hypothetical protein, partial [Cesiribacter andamanensis]|uniref:hypothetical protein n=1 Tax=Cesiribacter andamanensis TaxID=649507 RepID=UPI00058B148C